MDPARVDGLARVLDSVAKDRQVIVFTHDDRLPEAVRRMGLDALVVEVTRLEGSVVELRQGLDPVGRRSHLQQDRPDLMAGVQLYGPDARTLLSSADELLSTASDAWAGRWPRAVALLTRQALERSMDELWAVKAPTMIRASARAKI